MRITGASRPACAAGASPDSPEGSFLPQPARVTTSASGMIEAIVARRDAFTKKPHRTRVEGAQVCGISRPKSRPAETVSVSQTLRPQTWPPRGTAEEKLHVGRLQAGQPYGATMRRRDKWLIAVVV